MMKGYIKEVKDAEGIDGVYLTIWVSKPQNTFSEKETEKEIKKKAQDFKAIHLGKIEFQYKDESNE